MYRIMIVEDDATITGVLRRQLEKWGYAVSVPVDFARVLAVFEAEKPDLVLMDISLPYYDGYYWCGEIRRISQVPIIFISSAGEDMNLVMAVNMGADDFVVKPFSMDVITAKIQAVLRRTYAFGKEMNVLRAGGAVLNLTEAVLSFGDERLALSKNEFRILQTLMGQPGSPVSRDTLIEKLWETESFIDDNTLTVNMTRLRKKLEEIGLSGWIKTRKGLGYLIASSDEEEKFESNPSNLL